MWHTNPREETVIIGATLRVSPLLVFLSTALCGAGEAGMFMPLAAGPSQARIFTAPPEGAAPLEVDLKARVSGGQGPFVFEWDFGDGSDPAKGRKQEHTYPETGQYKVTVRVVDSLGATAFARAVIKVQPADEPFWVSSWLEFPDGANPYVIQFRATAKGGVGNYKYLWDFGDGSSSTRRNPKHAYRKMAGAYVLTLTVASGRDSITEQQILVLGPYGVPLEVQCSSSGVAGSAPYTATFSAVVAGGTEPYTYLWDMGDGTGKIEGMPVTHTYLHPGDYAAIVIVTAADGLNGLCICEIRAR